MLRYMEASIGELNKRLEKREIYYATVNKDYLHDFVASVLNNQHVKNSEDIFTGLDFLERNFGKVRSGIISSALNGIRFLNFRMKSLSTKDVKILRNAAIEFIKEYIQYCKRALVEVSRRGAVLIRDQDQIMTHCHCISCINVLRTAFCNERRVEIFVKETRPLLQGYLTARKLRKLGIPVTFIVDSALGFYLRETDLVLIGADCVCADGSIVNKIGTFPLAATAKAMRRRVVVVAESFKFRPELKDPLSVLEIRSSEEIVSKNRLHEVKVVNPAFDVTPPQFIDDIVTEIGIIKPPEVSDFSKKFFEKKGNRIFYQIPLEGPR